VQRGLTRNEVLGLAVGVLLSLATVALDVAGVDELVVFGVSSVGLLVLAWIVGQATEHLGESLGGRLGAILNATFGNAAELIITILAIRAGQLEVVTASITGSILGNVLLVLGASFLVGGLKNGLQTFDHRVAGMNASMLLLAVIGLALPTAFAATGGTSTHEAELVSDITAGILLALYVLMLVFYFRTPGAQPHHPEAQGERAAHWSPRLGAGILFGATVAVAVVAEIFVGTLHHIIDDVGVPAVFLGLILVPVVGNIAEHLAGIKIAYGNNMDFSMGVSLGSSLQIALGVAPVLVFVSLLTPHHFDLSFPPIQVLALAVAAILTAAIASDGESNWLEGAQLIGVYLIIATAVWFL
jgi:Ca2+:H+ antiporter